MKKILATVLGVVFAMFAFAGCNMAAADGTATGRQRHYEHRYDGRHHRCVLLPDDRPRKEAQEESAGDA